MASSFDIDVIGQDALIRVLMEAAHGAPEVLGKALHEEGQLAFRQSQREVPIRKGYLKNSGRLSQPEMTGGGTVSVTITYGSSATRYAAAVHDLNKNYRNGRKWHYVADPMRARAEGMSARLTARIARILGG